MSVLSKLFKIREQSPDGDIVKPFLDHLEDLRWMLIKMVIALAVGMVIAFCFIHQLSSFLQAPLHTVLPTVRLTTTDPTEGFMISLSVAFYSGMILAFPFIFFFLSEFVLPALTKAEKKYVFPAIACGTALFAAGVAVCYYYILPRTLLWFYQYNEANQYENLWRAKDYYALVTHFCLACGILCELPIAMLALSFMNIISYDLLARTRPYAITGLLILVVIIAPTPDPLTFITLAVPVLAIFEGCIWLVRLLEIRRAKQP